METSHGIASPTAPPAVPPVPPQSAPKPRVTGGRRKLVTVPMAVLLAAAILLFLGQRWLPASRSGDLVAMGTLEAVELTIASEVAGRVEEVLADEGDVVQRGDAVVRLDSSVPDLQYRLAGPTDRQLLLLQLEKYTLRAPREGRVLRRAVQPGEVAVPGAGLLTIADPGRLELTVYVLQRDLGRLTVGVPVDITAEALPNETYAGIVASVNDKAEFTPRNTQTAKDRLNLVFAVRVRVTTPDDRLKPGMSVTVRFPA